MHFCGVYHVVGHKLTDVSEQLIAVLLLLIKVEVVNCCVPLTLHTESPYYVPEKEAVVK